MKSVLKSLQKSHDTYTLQLNKATDFIRSKAEFDCFIFFQPSDGFVIGVDIDNGMNAPLDKCLEIIEKKGILSLEDFLQQSI